MLRFVISFLFSAVAFSSPTELYRSEKPLRLVLIDQKDPSFILVATDTKNVSRVDLQNGMIVDTYEDLCGVSQVASLAFPYFVGISKTCYFDRTSKTLVSLNDTPAHENDFYITYFGEDQEKAYFVFNGRPWGTNGYIKLKTIDKRDGRAAVRALIREIPGYSGAMVHDGARDVFLYTMWAGKNFLHEIEPRKIWALIDDEQTALFKDVAEKTFSFEGLSLTMSAGETALVYGEENTSYVIDRANGEKKMVSAPQGCRVLSLEGMDFLFLCNKSTIVRDAAKLYIKAR